MTAQRPREIICDVGALAPDALSIDALARLQLTAKRNGVRPAADATPRAELAELLAFAGLAGVLGLEASRQAEEREQRLGVEEERDLDDAARLRPRAPAAPTARSPRRSGSACTARTRASRWPRASG